MNTEQTNRTLAEIAFEAFDSAQDLGDPGHWYQQPADVKQWWEASAQAIATEVLKRLPGEWILLHEEEIIEIGDEKYSVGMWAPVSVNVLGKMVGGRIVRRRLSAPSQQPQLGSPEGLRSAQGESPPAVADVPRAPMTHTLKTWAEFYGKVASGEKNFEVRFNDRDFRVGDTLVLEEYDPQWRTFTGQKVERVVTYVLHGWGLKDDHVAMGLSERSTAVAPPPAPRAEWTPKFKVGDRVRVEGFQTTFTVEYLPHDSKDAYRMVGGYNAKENELTAAPWKLPEPPEKVQTDMFAMLQSIIKDLAEGNRVRQEFIDWVLGDVKAVYEVASTPLHAPSIPQPEEIPYEETDLFHARKALLDEGMRANTLKQERDAALARVKAAEDGQETWRKSSNTFQDRAIAAEARASEAEKRADERIAGYRDTAIEALEKARSHELELTTLRASVPVWVPLEAGKPTEGDRVIWTGDGGRCEIERVGDRRPYWSTHWMHLPLLPPLPVETGEDAFEKWWTVISQDWTGIQSAQWFAEQAWQAALSSTKP
jgi:hypothetical protein